MQRKLFKRQKAGEPISARTINQFADHLERTQLRVGGGIGMASTPGGPVISAPEPTWYFAFPTASIAARTGSPPNDLVPGSGEAQIYEWNPESSRLKIVGRNRTILNPFGNSVARALVKVDWRWGRWWIVAEDCNSTVAASPGFSTGFSSGFGVSSDGGTSSGTDSGFDGGFSSGFGRTPAVLTNEIQRLYWTGGPPTAGWFWFTIEGLQVGGFLGPQVQYNVTAANLQTQIDTAIGSGKVSCTGGPHNSAAIDIEFIGTLAGSNRATITIDGTSAGYTGTPTITVIQEGGL